MLTPRHQALLMTLAGMSVGVAVFGTVIVVNGDNPPAANNAPAGIVNSHPAAGTPARTDGLRPDALQFIRQVFGTTDAPVSAEVPSGWKSSDDGTRPRFLDPTGVWQVRFDTRGSKESPDQMVASRRRSIDEKDLEIASQANGTLVYTYTDKERGPRMGLSRWLSTDGGKTSAIEITVGGRPKDEAALRDVLQRATDTLQLPSAEGDTRPS
jgi:hypothetical protein